MKIKNLFTKSIDRPINGVVKVDQKDARTTWQELDEYVVTNELRGHYDKFFNAYLDALDNANDSVLTSQIGVWVSGFFGSGKSHFIKMLSYLLTNQPVTDPNSSPTKLPFDFFTEKLDNALFEANIKRAVDAQADVILFNIDSKADSQRSDSSLVQVFWSVFNELQGFSGDFPYVAELERYLTEKGAFDAFKQHFKSNDGNDWENERDAFFLKRNQIVFALKESLKISEDDAGRYYDNIDRNLNSSIDNFAKRVKEYLDRQPSQKRLVFVVDEVGQFIGSNTQLMLNLQTLVEELGVKCGGRAWVIVTSQEDVEAVLGEMNRRQQNDFSKILGRFNTRLKLSGINSDEVIQKRLLKKTVEAEAELKELFAEKGEVLRHQIVFEGGGNLKNFSSEDDFIRTYPFIPYQFELVQKIFESVRKYGATGTSLSQGERSMLDAFQTAALKYAENETDVLVPLSAFYPAIESFLEGAVIRILHSATDNSKLESFDGEILKVLFLLRYVENFKTKLDNLITLFIDKIDADLVAIRAKLESSLQRLEGQSLVNRNGDEYFFLTDEERRVTAEIKDVAISEAEEIRKVAEVLFQDVLADSSLKFRNPLNKNDYPFNLYCDGNPYKNPQNDNLDLRVCLNLEGEN